MSIKNMSIKKKKMKLIYLLILTLATHSVFGSKYEVTFYTGNEYFAGTDANVYLRLTGVNSVVSEDIKIPTKLLDMRQGSIDTYTIESKKVSGYVQTIRVWHDSKLINPSWFLNKVVLKELGTNGKVAKLMIFPVYRWLVKSNVIPIKLIPKQWLYVSEITTIIEAQRKRVSHCGVVSTPRIVNGKVASPHQFPWQAQIKIPYTFNPHSCGGTLIHPQYVLTAAHCVNLMTDPESYLVTLGEHDLVNIDGTEQLRNVSELILHPKYDRKTDMHDVALMKLSKPVILNNAVRLACVPKQKIEEGTSCILSGWGRQGYELDNPNKLNYAQLKIISQNMCKKGMSDLGNVIEKNMICAGAKGVSGCFGDSGGPLACRDDVGRYTVNGVVSWGSPSCSLDDNRYSIFTRISLYAGWIESKIYSKYIKK